MTVVVPYVPGMLHERTAAWVASARVSLLTYELDPADDEHYWWVLALEWRHPRADLVIVEQDVLPADGVVDDMLRCPHPWCSSPYEVANHNVITDGLGCVKFSARLMAQHPDLMERVGEIDDDGLPAKNWRRLDTRVSRLLRGLGYQPHGHARSEHLHDYAARP